MTHSDIRAELCSILNVAQPSKLGLRLTGMKLTPTCGRCGGSGRYSFNQIDGDRCYGCNGTGHRPATDRDLPEVLERAREAVADGSLDHYLQELEARRFAKTAMNQLFDLWKATRVAQALAGPTHFIRDHEIPGLAEIRAANARMANAQRSLQDVLFDRSKSGIERAEVARRALAEIEAADFDVPAETVAAIRAAIGR